jgi:hypothetical protein
MVLWCCAAGTKREIATIYEIVQDANGAAYALPDYQFTCEWIGLGAAQGRKMYSRAGSVVFMLKGGPCMCRSMCLCLRRVAASLHDASWIWQLLWFTDLVAYVTANRLSVLTMYICAYAHFTPTHPLTHRLAHRWQHRQVCWPQDTQLHPPDQQHAQLPGEHGVSSVLLIQER